MAQGPCSLCHEWAEELGECPICGDLVDLACFNLSQQMCLACVAESQNLDDDAEAS